MSIGPRLDLRQTQSLVMTPQLQQAIKLLQLNNLELNEFLREELEKNPLLERDETADDEKTEREKEFIQSENTLEKLQDLRQSKNGDGSSQSDGALPKDATPLDENYENIWTGGDSYADTGRGGSTNFDDDEFSFEKTLASEKSLRDHLQEQLFMACDDDASRAIGLSLIDRLTPAGYLRETPEMIARSLGIAQDRVEAVLQTVKQFDPTGIFAFDLKECLSLQLQEKDRFDPAMQALINNLDVLGRHDYKDLMKICGVDAEDLKDMILEIRALNPKPAGLFDTTVVQTAIPDVIITPKKTETGMGWAVELNTATLPRVLVNRTYYAEIKKMAHNKAEKEFLETHYTNANWLIKAMDQRAQTVLKVATEIVKQQDAFFAYGLHYLKPMTLKDIAEKIEMHESTVSRVTTNKYMGTPRGLFEMKFFFSSALGSSDGGIDVSSEAAKAKIKELIENESPKKVLSDDAIAEMLQKDGIDIARRTVAKYREALGLPTSAQRKREKRAGL